MSDRSNSLFSLLNALSTLIMLVAFGSLSFAQQCGVIHVTPNGGAGAAGTRTDPASLTQGLGLVTGTNNVIWMAVGTYPITTTLQIPSNVTLEGGFDPGTWIKSNGAATIISRSPANVIPAPANALVGLAALNSTGFRLQDLTIEVGDATAAEVSVYGIYLNGCSAYDIVRCVVTTGAAGAGLPGSPGGVGAAGGAGAAGGPAGFENAPPPGGAGGTGGNPGGAGGSGARHSPNASSTGSTGGGGCGGAGGATGDGPACGCGTFGTSNNNGCGGSGPGAGQPGGAGSAGTAGSVGSPGSFAGGYYVVGGAGGNGTDGGGGCGGGGGGGGAGRQQDGPDEVGGSGGGGGGGGFGGTGGTGGTGGGGSFAVFLIGNGAGGNIVDCFLNPGPGGVGGAGGAGGPGGPGGAGGAGGTGYGCGISVGGAGGAGGAGGLGGAGGTGATGPSAALTESGGTPVNQQNIIAVPGNPPVISVDNYGCTNSDILFSAGGGGSWNFGTGATPATASGAGPIPVSYSSTGRKTITLNGTPFTDFVLIFTDGPTTPSITPDNGTVDAGCPNDFTTSLVGTQYDWIFGPVAQPATLSGPNMTTASDIYFGVPGTYTIYVTVQTPCCGPVTDSTTVTVEANDFDVNLTMSATEICDGDPLTVSADGNYLNYSFFVNGTMVQDGANDTYTSSTIQNGDLINVLALVGSCFANPSDTIEAIVNPIPAVTLASDDADDEVCQGDLLTMTATPTGYDSYEFFNGNNSLQDGASNILFGSLLPNNLIYVVATDNGCSSVPSNGIVTVIHPIPQPVLSSSDNNNAICEGDNITFTVLPTGLADYEFFEGIASVQAGSANTYSTTTLLDGTELTVIATSAAGCVSDPSNAIVTDVNPYPAVTLSTSDADNTICEGESITFTATPAGYNSYEFLDGTTPVQETASESWTTTGLVDGNSITVVPTHLGCTGAATSAITITLIPSPVVDPGVDFDVCVDAANVTLTGFTPTTGTWSGPGITNATGIFSPATAGAGLHTLSYAVSNGNCTTTETIEATVNALPPIAAGPARTICLGESIDLNASGGVSYVWSPTTGLSDATIADPTAIPTASTTYIVTGTDANGCENTAQTVITVDPLPTADFSSTAVCVGEMTEFVSTSEPVGSITYQWSFGDGGISTEENPEYLYLEADTNDVQLVVVWGNCTDTATGTSIVHPRPETSFIADPRTVNVIDPLIQFDNTSSGDETWVWDFGDAILSDEEHPNHAYRDTGVYEVQLTAISDQGCRDSTTLEVTVTPYTTIHVPSAFTPGSDGVNDIFRAYAEDITGFEMQIFNRWGQLVHYSTNIEQGWDGGPYGDGEMCEGAVYTWVIYFVDFRGRTQQIGGKVVLVR